MKRIIALIMASVLLFGCLCGCGKSEEADDGSTVTLVVAIPWATQRDTNKVEGVINEKLKELLPNTQIKLMLDSAFAEKWTLWMATKKVIDVAHSGWETNLEAEIRQDTYLPLNDLVEKHAPNIKEMEVKYFYCYDNAKMNGELYAVPNVVPLFFSLFTLIVYSSPKRILSRIFTFLIPMCFPSSEVLLFMDSTNSLSSFSSIPIP